MMLLSSKSNCFCVFYPPLSSQFLFGCMMNCSIWVFTKSSLQFTDSGAFILVKVCDIHLQLISSGIFLYFITYFCSQFSKISSSNYTIALHFVLKKNYNQFLNRSTVFLDSTTNFNS